MDLATTLLSDSDSSHVALVQPPDVSLTYGQLKDCVADLAAALQALDLSRHDPVALVLPPGLPAVIATLAAATAAIAVPLNPAFKRDEFRFFFDDMKVRLVIVPEGAGGPAREAAGTGIQIIEISCDPAAGVVFANGARARGRRSFRAPHSEDTAMIFYTSGTTSRPKQVPLKHRNLVASAANIAAAYDLSPGDVSLCVMPLFHVHGLVGSALSSLKAGSTVVVSPGFNPLSFWTTVRSHRVTWFSAVPAIHQMLLERHRRGSRPHGSEGLRFVRSCSSFLTRSTAEELERLFEVPVLEAYGMTEAAHQIATNPLPPRQRKLGSVGFPFGVDLRLRDDEGSLRAGGAKGEIVIRGATVMEGYARNPAANAESFADGWFRTGDEGSIDPEGHVTLLGRIKELINRGGEKISPAEVDLILQSHPSVIEAATFGVPHRIYGMEVEAMVVLRSPLTDRELRDYCSTHMADFKCPKKFHFVDRVPRTSTGKIQRTLLTKSMQS